MAEKTETYLVREAEEQDMGSMLSYEEDQMRVVTKSLFGQRDKIL